jgi:hypothetical protein
LPEKGGLTAAGAEPTQSSKKTLLLPYGFCLNLLPKVNFPNVIKEADPWG